MWFWNFCRSTSSFWGPERLWSQSRDLRRPWRHCATAADILIWNKYFDFEFFTEELQCCVRLRTLTSNRLGLEVGEWEDQLVLFGRFLKAFTFKILQSLESFSETSAVHVCLIPQRLPGQSPLRKPRDLGEPHRALGLRVRFEWYHFEKRQKAALNENQIRVTGHVCAVGAFTVPRNSHFFYVPMNIFCFVDD